MLCLQNKALEGRGLESTIQHEANHNTALSFASRPRPSHALVHVQHFKTICLEDYKLVCEVIFLLACTQSCVLVLINSHKL